MAVYLYEVTDLNHRGEITYKAETKPALRVPTAGDVKRCSQDLRIDGTNTRIDNEPFEQPLVR
jgi:hypothetical protein